MELHYDLSEDDLLVNQLYLASKSSLFSKALRRGIIIFPITQLAFGLFVYFVDDSVKGLLWFSAIALLWVVLFPLFYKRYYRKQYQKYIQQTQKEGQQRWASLSILDTQLEAMDESNSIEIEYNEFSQLVELDAHFILTFKSSGSLIIPKHAVDNHQELIHLLGNRGVAYKNDVKWSW